MANFKRKRRAHNSPRTCKMCKPHKWAGNAKWAVKPSARRWIYGEAA